MDVSETGSLMVRSPKVGDEVQAAAEGSDVPASKVDRDVVPRGSARDCVCPCGPVLRQCQAYNVCI